MTASHEGIHTVMPRSTMLARTGICALLGFLALVAPATPAHAGSYDVYACHDGGPNHSWADSTDGVDDTTNGASCTPSGVNPDTRTNVWGTTALQARQGVSPFSQYNGKGARLTISIPDGGMAVTRISADFRVQTVNNGAFSYISTPSSFVAKNGTFGLAQSGWITQTYSGLWTPWLQLGTVCDGAGTCYRTNNPPAQVAARNVRVTIEDPHVPAISVLGGNLWNDGIWQRGTRSLTFRGSDNIGIRRLEFLVFDANQWKLAAAQGNGEGCDYTYTRPCPGHKDFSFDVNTAQYTDGAHTVKMRAYDAANNVTDLDGTINIDNSAPAKPDAALASWMNAVPHRGFLEGADTGWQVKPESALRWSNGAGYGGPSAIASNVMQICRVDDTGCFTKARVGGEHWTDVATLPAPGAWKLRVQATDQAGNESAWSDWVPVRYDGRAPGLAGFSPNAAALTNGWVGERTANDFAQSLGMAASQQDLSDGAGLAGYSVSFQRPGEPEQEPDGDLADALDLKLPAGDTTGKIVLPSVPDGVSILRVRAIGANGIAATVAADLSLRADRRGPSVTITPDAVDATYRAATQHSITATDVDAPAPALATGRAGMEGAAAQAPLDHGAYVEYQVDDRPAVRVRGGAVQVPAQRGQHTLTYSAVDVAGNRSTVKRLRYTLNDGASESSATTAADVGPNGAGASARAQLVVGWEGAIGAELVRPFGAIGVARGRLIDERGTPIRDAEVEVIETLKSATAARSFERTVQTSGDGAFSYALAPRTTNRSLRFVYRAERGKAKIADEKTLTWSVRSRITLRVKIRHGVVQYSGKVPPAGHVVALQGRGPGGRWQTFAARRVNSAGRFKGSYRLRAAAPGMKLGFRARVVPADGSVRAATTRTIYRVAK